MNRRNTIPFVISIVLLAGLASANRLGTLAAPQGDTPKPKPSASASAQPKEKPKPAPKPPEGGW